MAGRAMQILGFSGSLRRESFNTRLLRHFADALPKDVQFSQAEISDIPLFDADVLQSDGFPKSVSRLIEAVRSADAIVFATPEYNYSIPGVLKNAIDWISREKPGPFAGKPVAIMSASTSLLGGVRAQYHLRQVLVYLDAHAVNRPEIFLGSAPQRFDADGRLIDATAAGLVVDLAAALLKLEKQLASEREQAAAGGAAPSERAALHR